MSDGDTYDVCSCCGTEKLQRAMIRQTASGIYFCQRCDEINRCDDPNELQPEDDCDEWEHDCPHCEGSGCNECNYTGEYE